MNDELRADKTVTVLARIKSLNRMFLLSFTAFVVMTVKMYNGKYRP